MMQLNFIEFVIFPFVTTMVKIFPPLEESAQHMGNNFGKWAGKRKGDIDEGHWLSEDADREQEKKKIDDRVVSFHEKLGTALNLT